MTPVLSVVLSAVMRLRGWSRRATVTAGPVPPGESRVRARGASSDRVLFFGSGPAVGWGVVTHDLAVAGNLARMLSAHTGRGTDIDIVADPRLSIRSSRARLSSLDVRRYDAIVLVLGLGDAVRFTALTKWRRELTGLLSYATGEISRAALVFVTTIPAVSSVSGYGRILGRRACAHAERMNHETLEVVSGFSGASVVELSAPMPGVGIRANYERWARELATVIAPRLENSRLAAEDTVVHDHVASDAERWQQIEQLRILGTGGEERFDRIVAEARSVFGTTFAVFAIIDGDRLWFKSYVGSGLPPVELVDSFTRATLSQRGAMVIPDALADPRFKDSPYVTGAPRIRFWAGFPVESPNGVRVGTLSVFDTSPREPDPNWDEPVLRHFALQLQEQLDP